MASSSRRTPPSAGRGGEERSPQARTRRGGADRRRRRRERPSRSADAGSDAAQRAASRRIDGRVGVAVGEQDVEGVEGLVGDHAAEAPRGQAVAAVGLRRRPGRPRPTGPSRCSAPDGPRRAGGGPARRGRRCRRRSWPGRRGRAAAATDENSTKKSRGSSSVSVVQVPGRRPAWGPGRRAGGRRPARSRVASASRPAACTTPRSGGIATAHGAPARRRARRGRRRRRPGTDLGAALARRRGDARVAAPADGRPAPEQGEVAGAARRRGGRRRRGRARPRPPVIEVGGVRAHERRVGLHRSRPGTVSTSLPMWRAWAIVRKASAASVIGAAVTGSGPSSPAGHQRHHRRGRARPRRPGPRR